MDDVERRRRGTARFVRIKDDDGSFDLEFWQRLTMQERVEAVWDLTLEYLQWSGQDGGEPRLQRSVCRVERRGR
ncbi:MAG: hypothetical protein AB2A00_11960 [Myxococcota bacterium]